MAIRIAVIIAAFAGLSGCITPQELYKQRFAQSQLGQQVAAGQSDLRPGVNARQAALPAQ
jgi:hypothetical protein